LSSVDDSNDRCAPQPKSHSAAHSIQRRDVAATLEAECSDAAYTCAVASEDIAWDPEVCEPWDPVGPTGGETEGSTDTTDGSATQGGSASYTDLTGNPTPNNGATDGDSAGLEGDGSGCACTATASGSREGALLSLLLMGGLGIARRRRASEPRSRCSTRRA
jgi:MYXO-CTERM domain-containing protein